MATDSASALQRAIDAAGSQEKLAAAIGTSQSQVSYWLVSAKKGVPAEWCPKIEVATGVTSHELRPDIFPEKHKVTT